MTILITDKTYFKRSLIIWDKKRYYMMIKMLIHQKAIAILHVKVLPDKGSTQKAKTDENERKN